MNRTKNVRQTPGMHLGANCLWEIDENTNHFFGSLKNVSALTFPGHAVIDFFLKIENSIYSF